MHLAAASCRASSAGCRIFDRSSLTNSPDWYDSLTLKPVDFLHSRTFWNARMLCCTISLLDDARSDMNIAWSYAASASRANCLESRTHEPITCSALSTTDGASSCN